MTSELPSSRGGGDGLLSLFCGAGGLDLGFERSGLPIAAAFDIRPDAVASYNHNRVDERRVARVADIRALSPQHLDRVVGRRFEPRGIIGGPPCQSFSRATHSGEDDPRHDLPLSYAMLIHQLNQRKAVEFFVMENVPGLLKPKHSDRLRSFLSAFDSAGFSVSHAVLNARHFGVGQNRPRLICVGMNRSIFGSMSWSPPHPTTTATITVRDTIGSLPDATYWRPNLDPKLITHHRNHWCMTPKSISFTTAGRLIPGTSRGRSFRTLAWDDVSPTVAYGNREVHVHPQCHRRLSVHEALLLQGFPNTFELLGSLSSQITQVSEAVPPPMGEAVARSIAELLASRATSREIETVA